MQRAAGVLIAANLVIGGFSLCPCAAQAAALALAQAAAPGRIGLAVRPLSADERRQFGANGLIVEQASGAAARAGVRAGDVLLRVNGTPIDSVAELRTLVAQSTKTMAILLERRGGKIFIPIDLDGDN